MEAPGGSLAQKPDTTGLADQIGGGLAEAVTVPRGAEHKAEHPILVFCLFWVLYLLSGAAGGTGFTAHVYLADSFLHGRFDIPNCPGYFEKTVFEGKTYVAYGIMPALLMLPFVALWGLRFPQSIFSAGLAATTVALWYDTLRKMGTSTPTRYWLTATFGLGSLFWFAGGHAGDTWMLMHVGLCFGAMLAFRELWGKQRAWIVGLGFALAVLSRQTFFLALPFFLGMLWKPATRFPILASRYLGFALPCLALLGFNAFYDWARFHNPFDNGYAKVIMANLRVQHGFFSLQYLHDNLHTYFLATPPRLDHFPWFDPTMAGFSMLISLPALVLAAFANYHRKENFLALAAILPILAFYLVYHWSGYAQFGCRYSIDFLPFVMLLIAAGTRGRTGDLLIGTTVLGAAVEVWGLFWFGMNRM